MPSAEVAAVVNFWADVGTLIALLLAAGALYYAGRQLWSGRRGTSAAALIALHESFRQAWLHFSVLPSDDEADRQHALADIMNLLEMACAIFKDKLFVGHSGKLLEDYLVSIFVQLRDSDDARERMLIMLQDPETFEHVVDFLRAHYARVRFPLDPNSCALAPSAAKGERWR